MEKQEALDRLKLIETMVSENRGAQVDNGRGMIYVGLLMPALLLLANVVDFKTNPFAKKIAAGIALILLMYAAVDQWRRYQRFKRNPTLAYRIYTALALCSAVFIVPVEIMTSRGLMQEEAVIALLYALLALTFAIYRHVLGHAWLNAVAGLWFIGSCLAASALAIPPVFLACVLSILGCALPGWLIHRSSRTA